jgi:4-amino-4-deoxy-L-arabinose transferase-like glycosyltransferase
VTVTEPGAASDAPAASAPPSARPDRRFWIVLGCITAAALAWRIGYDIAQIGRLRLNGDAAYYHWQANDIAEGRWFIDPGQYKFFGRVTPSAGHPPVYLLYLASVSKFIGTSETTHRIASTFLGAGAVFMVGVLARRLFASNWAGWVGASLAAVYAHLWINDEMLMSESAYVLTALIAVWGAYRFWDKPSWKTAVLMGAGIALATLTRAEAGVLLAILAVPFALMRREFPWKQRFKLALLACLAGAVVLSPWVGYNLTRFEHPVVMSNGIGSVLMVANCEYTVPEDGTVISTYDGRWAGYWNIACALDLDERIREFYPTDRAAELEKELGLIPGTDFAVLGDESTHEVAWRAVGLKEIRRHQDELLTVTAKRVLRMWDLYRPNQNISFNADIEGRGRWQSRLAALQYYPLLILAVVGLVLLRRRKVPILPFLAFAISVTITAAMTFGITRYRAPVDALLPVLAGGAIVWIVDRIRRARTDNVPAAS